MSFFTLIMIKVLFSSQQNLSLNKTFELCTGHGFLWMQHQEIRPQIIFYVIHNSYCKPKKMFDKRIYYIHSPRIRGLIFGGKKSEKLKKISWMLCYLCNFVPTYFFPWTGVIKNHIWISYKSYILHVSIKKCTCVCVGVIIHVYTDIYIYIRMWDS